jgi:hypothetical protein
MSTYVERTVSENLIEKVVGSSPKEVKRRYEERGYRVVSFKLLRGEGGENRSDEDGNTHVIFAEKVLWELNQGESNFAVSVRRSEEQEFIDVMKDDGDIESVPITKESFAALKVLGVYNNIEEVSLHVSGD